MTWNMYNTINQSKWSLRFLTCKWYWPPEEDMSLDIISDKRMELNTELTNRCDRINTVRSNINSGRLQHNGIL